MPDLGINFEQRNLLLYSEVWKEIQAIKQLEGQASSLAIHMRISE